MRNEWHLYLTVVANNCHNYNKSRSIYPSEPNVNDVLRVFFSLSLGKLAQTRINPDVVIRQILLTPINPEVISLFPVRRGAHFLSEWQRRSEVTEGGQQSVSHQHPSALSPSLHLLCSLVLLHSFSSILHQFLKPFIWFSAFHRPLLSTAHSSPLTPHLLLLLSRWHALPSVPLG